MLIKSVTKKQVSILLLLYKFRFLSTNQMQLLLSHKSPSLVQSWLKDLVEKGYIVSSYRREIRNENTKPAIFHLASPARHILKKEKDIALKALKIIYKEKRRGQKFIDHCLDIADIYLYFQRHLQNNQELKFFTRTTLTGYDYFPDPMPDAYLALKDSSETKRYFLDLFDAYTPPFVYRKRIRQYLEYARNGDWEANTNQSQLPSLYFVCPNDNAKKHVYWYGKRVLEKSFEDVSLFVSTIDTIKYVKGNKDPWLRVI